MRPANVTVVLASELPRWLRRNRDPSLQQNFGALAK